MCANIFDKTDEWDEHAVIFCACYRTQLTFASPRQLTTLHKICKSCGEIKKMSVWDKITSLHEQDKASCALCSDLPAWHVCRYATLVWDHFAIPHLPLATCHLPGATCTSYESGLAQSSYSIKKKNYSCTISLILIELESYSNLSRRTLSQSTFIIFPQDVKANLRQQSLHYPPKFLAKVSRFSACSLNIFYFWLMLWPTVFKVRGRYGV